MLGEVLLPEPWREEMDVARWVALDTLQDIHQVGVRIDALQTARPQQALDDADVLGANLGPTKEPIASIMESSP